MITYEHQLTAGITPNLSSPTGSSAQVAPTKDHPNLNSPSGTQVASTQDHPNLIFPSHCKIPPSSITPTSSSLLARRNPLKAAPTSLHLDPYTCQCI